MRQLAVQELAHRLKNKIATIQAIISVQLRDQPQVRSDILERLGALTATDHLIEEANGRGAFVRAIAETELGPYVASRVAIRGPNVLLPPKYALTVALLIDELATNSAKYGSLSMPDGRVSSAVEHVGRGSSSPSGRRRRSSCELSVEAGLRLAPPVTRAGTVRGRYGDPFRTSGPCLQDELRSPAGTRPQPVDDDSGQHLTAATTKPAIR